MESYDLVVIGGGPGGYLAAERAGHAGLKTVVFEKKSFGGVCLNEGCVPSKTFLNSAKVFDYANHAKAYGVTVEGKTSVDQKFVVERKNGVVKMLVSGVEGQLKRNKVKMVKAEATIKAKTNDGIIIQSGADEYLAKRLIIATGSMPVVPPIPGLRENIQTGVVMTNK